MIATGADTSVTALGRGLRLYARSDGGVATFTFNAGRRRTVRRRAFAEGAFARIERVGYARLGSYIVKEPRIGYSRAFSEMRRLRWSDGGRVLQPSWDLFFLFATVTG